MTYLLLINQKFQKLNLNYQNMYFDKLNTIVIKIGSSLIIDEKKKIRSKWLDSFVKDIRDLKKNR